MKIIKIDFFVLILILLVGFLILPQISLATSFEEITPEQRGEYLELPERDVENLLNSLIGLFNSEWINLEVSTRSTAKQRAVPNIMREAVRIQALNHLLVDAPIEVAWKITKSALEISRLIGAQDISIIIDKFEKETVKMAIDYGMNSLLQNEIKMMPDRKSVV